MPLTHGSPSAAKAFIFAATTANELSQLVESPRLLIYRAAILLYASTRTPCADVNGCRVVHRRPLVVQQDGMTAGFCCLRTWMAPCRSAGSANIWPSCPSGNDQDGPSDMGRLKKLLYKFQTDTGETFAIIWM